MLHCGLSATSHCNISTLSFCLSVCHHRQLCYNVTRSCASVVMQPKSSLTFPQRRVATTCYWVSDCINIYQCTLFTGGFPTCPEVRLGHKLGQIGILENLLMLFRLINIVLKSNQNQIQTTWNEQLITCQWPKWVKSAKCNRCNRKRNRFIPLMHWIMSQNATMVFSTPNAIT